MLGKLKETLEKNGFIVNIFETKKEAASYLGQQITNTTVGIGGSVTVEEMGLYDILSANNQVFWHWRVPDGMTGDEILQKERNADVYISSVNALSQSGEIINIDGNCNRVADIFYGHSAVYLSVGINKIADTFDLAMDRARNIAAPKNAKRLARKTPCAVKGDRCYNCNSPARICNGVSVLLRKPSNGAQYHILLINENLGY